MLPSIVTSLPLLVVHKCNPDCRCCNTCNDLIQAYQRKQWSVNDILRNSTQCIHDRAKHFANLAPDEGCMVSGHMLVNKVAGNFHIAQGESIVRDGRHIHQFNPTLAPKFNVSHTIHELSFGEPYPSMSTNPLDGGTKTACRPFHRLFDRNTNFLSSMLLWATLTRTQPSASSPWTSRRVCSSTSSA